MNILFKSYSLIFFALISFNTIAQNKTCESEGSNDLLDMNAIGKCSIERFRASKNEGYVKVATRNRLVRKKSSNYFDKIKENLNAIAKQQAPIVGSDLTRVKAEVKDSEILKENIVRDFVRFDDVANIPIFITCTETSQSIKKECVKETFTGNILENLIYPFDAAAEGIQGVVWIRFIIDVNGYVKNITATGPVNGELLEEEAKRLISLLPRFVPGKNNDEFVNVEYFLPIDFQLNG